MFERGYEYISVRIAAFAPGVGPWRWFAFLGISSFFLEWRACSEVNGMLLVLSNGGRTGPFYISSHKICSSSKKGPWSTSWYVLAILYADFNIAIQTDMILVYLDKVTASSRNRYEIEHILEMKSASPHRHWLGCLRCHAESNKSRHFQHCLVKILGYTWLLRHEMRKRGQM